MIKNLAFTAFLAHFSTISVLQPFFWKKSGNYAVNIGENIWVLNLVVYKGHPLGTQLKFEGGLVEEDQDIQLWAVYA